VMRDLPGLVFSVSHTTRQPRATEQSGIHYHFVDHAAFTAMRDQQPSGFLEWAEVHGNLYGTSVEEVARQQQAGNDVLLDIDIQGAAQVRQRSLPVSIFIAPPSMDELARRLCGRGSESEANIALRLNNARKELACACAYDYLIVNDQLDEAVDCLRSIIIAERCRQHRGQSTQQQRGF
jgi:guanylate kinase